MWSLPSISKLNAQAVAEHMKRRGRAPSPRGKKCDSCGGRAKHMIPYHDLFGDEKTREIPKGFIPVCSECYESGRWEEGFFSCDGCGKEHVTHYTHEVYFRDYDNGDEPARLCLECAFIEALEGYDAESDPWLYKEDLIRLEDGIAEGHHESAMEWIREKAKHLIAVETRYWQEWLAFQANVECDSSSGGRLIGFSSCEPSPLGTVQDVIEHIRAALAIAPRCALILDATYQFSFSLGIYYELEFAQADLEQADVREVTA